LPFYKANLKFERNQILWYFVNIYQQVTNMMSLDYSYNYM